MNEGEKKQRDRVNPPGKRPYRKPRLEIYGELGQITGMVGMKGAADGGAGKSNQTR